MHITKTGYFESVRKCMNYSYGIGYHLENIRRTTMFKRSVLALILLCAGHSAQAEMQQITTKADFLAKVAGKTLSNSQGTYVIYPDGTLKGKVAGGKKLSGSWAWQGKFWCRNAIIEGKGETGTDCQKVELDGDKLRQTREKGKGKPVDFILK